MDILDIIARLSKAFQSDHLTVGNYLDALSTANIELSSFLDSTTDGKFKGMDLMNYQNEGNAAALSNMRDIITQVQDRMNTCLEKDIHGTVPILKAMANAFEPTMWTHDEQLLAVYGRDDVSIIADNFQLALEKHDFNKKKALNTEWPALKAFIRNRMHNVLSRDSQQIRELWSLLFMGNVLSERFHNILMLVEITLVSALSSSVCERGFSATKCVKSDWRAMLDNLMIVCIQGPTFDSYDPESALCRWLSSGQLKRRVHDLTAENDLNFD